MWHCRAGPQHSYGFTIELDSPSDFIGNVILLEFYGIFMVIHKDLTNKNGDITGKYPLVN